MIEFWQGSTTVIMSITHIVIRLAPVGVFALIAKMSAVTGYDAFRPLNRFFSSTVALALGIHFFMTLPLILKCIAKVKPFSPIIMLWHLL